MTSNSSTYGSIDGLEPRTVIEPRSVEDLRTSIAEAAASGSTVVPVGGGTRLDLGNPPDGVGTMVSTRQLDRLVRHTPDDLTAAAESGVTIARLQTALAEHGQYLAVDPPLPERATLGGTLAVGHSGPAKWQYGNVRDCVIGLSVVQADGNLTKSGGQVVKNVSGYDLVRMHVGALGTLGVIAEASLKLTPLPRTETTLLSGFESLKAAWQAGLEVFRSPVVPLALTVFDAQAASLIPTSAELRSAFVAIRLGGRPLTIERQVRECRTLIDQADGTLLENLDRSEASPLWNGLRDFGWSDETQPSMLLRAMAKPTDGASAIEALARLNADATALAFVGHPAHGTINAGWFGEAEPPGADALLEARRCVEGLGGRLVIERCPAPLKSDIDVWGDPGPAFSTMRRLKKEFDPARVFNPGRYVGRI